MIGAIIGDIVGSYYEVHRVKTKDFPLLRPESTFTDDTVLSVAVAEHLLTGEDIVDLFHNYVLAYPLAGYGTSFFKWAMMRERKPYKSYGNGAAMRISPVGFAYDDMEEAFKKAEEITVVTHNHPEAVKAAKAVVAAIILGKEGKSKPDIKEFIKREFGYDLERRLDEIRPRYRFDITCQGSVPEAIISFLESTDYVDALRNAISLGGDADTMACIAGGIAQAYYGEVPVFLRKKAMEVLDGRLKSVIKSFCNKFYC